MKRTHRPKLPKPPHALRNELQQYGIPMIIGIMSSLIAYAITKDSKTGLASFAAIVLFTIGLRLTWPRFARLRIIGQSEVRILYADQDAAAPQILHLVETARRIDILTVRGLGIVGLNDSLLRKDLERKPTVGSRNLTVLVLNPDCANARRRAIEVRESDVSFSGGIRLGIERLRELAGGDNELDVTVSMYDSLPTWRLIIVDDNAFVSLYDRSTEGHRSPMYWLDGTKDGPLFRAVRRTFDEMLVSGKQIV